MRGDISDGGCGGGGDMGWGATEPQQPRHPALGGTSDLNEEKDLSI